MKERIAQLNYEIESLGKLGEKLPRHSKEYRDYLRKEIALLQEKQTCLVNELNK